MLRRAVLLAAAGCLAAASVSLAADKPTDMSKSVRASRVAPGFTWEGQQYPAADKKGRVFILRTETLEVYPVEDGELGEPRALESAGIGTPDPAIDAAMDEHGDWVILEGFQPRWFRSGEEVFLPQPPWLPSSVELLDGRPVVSVFPFPVGRGEHGDIAPRVLEYDGDSWSELIESELKRPTTAEERMRMHQKEATHSYVDPDDTLWLANHFRYKITRYSAAGRELVSFKADGAEVEHVDETDVEARRTDLEQERARYANPGEAEIQVNTAVPVIRAMAEGRDGRLYILVRDGDGGLALDRLDSVQGVVARVAITARSPGAISMAAGRDGLYLVPYNGRDKRWFISWESLEAADWLPLEGVEGLAPAVGETQEGR